MLEEESQLDRIEKKLDKVIELLIPVNEHAPFVGDLKEAVQNSMVLRRIVPVRSPAMLIQSPQTVQTSDPQDTT